ncbi:MAG: hypothetical protein NTW21_24280 [Verrucomicrobia bacterium]|nr:hypothetical protein [Verrucomicrobiota bacterium]
MATPDPFEGVLTEAQKLLRRYWATLNDTKLTHKERSARSLQYSQALESLPFFDQFLEEFVACIHIEALLKQAEADARQ